MQSQTLKLHVCVGGTLDYKSTAFQIKLKPHDTVHKIYKTCSPVTDLLWPYRIKQKKKKSIWKALLLLTQRAPKQEAVSKSASCGLTKSRRRMGAQPAFPVIAGHRFWASLSELLSSIAKNMEISLGIDRRRGGGLTVEKNVTFTAPPQFT